MVASGGSGPSEFAAHDQAVRDAFARARGTGAFPGDLDKFGVRVRPDGRRRSVLELLGHDGVEDTQLAAAFPWLHELPSRVLTQLRTEARYAGYLHRQDADIRGFRRDEAVSLADISFEDIGGLSAEIREKLLSGRPGSLGAAARIQGMTPAALAAISAHLRRPRWPSNPIV